jgi:imidazolonepropionase
VKALRKASKADLEAMVRPRLDSFIRHGTTTIEAKSGYGLSLADEIKSLEVLDSLSRSHPIGVVPTFLGGHEIPPEYRHDRRAYVKLLVETMIPEVARRGIARFCDVFCERNVFTVGESREILLAAKAAGLKPRIHADEFSALGASELAGEIGAVTADHLVAVKESGMDAMLAAGVIPVLLPATSFFINLPNDAPARRMIEKGLSVALSSDFNPGSSMTESMQMVMTMACVRLHMSPAECFTAATVNSACAVCAGDRIGMLAPGFQADIAVFGAPNYRMIPYHFGVNHVTAVVKAGNVVHESRPALSRTRS